MRHPVAPALRFAVPLAVAASACSSSNSSQPAAAGGVGRSGSLSGDSGSAGRLASGEAGGSAGGVSAGGRSAGGGSAGSAATEPPEGCATVVDAASAASARLPYRGVSLAGAEFGEGSLPGEFGSDYIYPDPELSPGYDSAAYYVSKRMTTFRLPFRWERLQRQLGADFDAAELGRLRQTVQGLSCGGAYVVLDPHNYARYDGAVIGQGVSSAQFADFWRRLAMEFGGNDRVLFALMNEPNSMPTEPWAEAANAAIAAIRDASADNLILVPGNAWTGAHSWAQDWYGTPNAAAMLSIVDPADNYAFEVHQYLDDDFSGRAAQCGAGAGSQTLVAFTTWLRDNGKRGFLGEFGAGSNAACDAALDDLLGYVEAQSDVWIGWTWWAGGPWWGNYFMTLEPTDGVERPQMSVLERHLGPLMP